jgi:hypothetical protein
MPDNPYQYAGQLDPQDPNLIFNNREEDVNRVIQGIRRGDYWTILGPRQIGKTTFLFLLKHQFKEANYIDFDFQVAHSNEKKFYQWLIYQFQEKIPNKKKKYKNIERDSPALSFINFLENFKPKEEKKIILLFDEIDNLGFLRNFLHVWRKVFHKRIQKKELYRYAVIITGSVDLIEATIGQNSPFNIAKTLYIKDFSDVESEKLIVEPLNHLNIRIEQGAKEKLLTQISGHPQMLQHACYLLVERAKALNEPITIKDVDVVIERLFNENASLDLLKHNIKKDDILKNLVKDILRGNIIKFAPYAEYAISGAGAIKEEDSYCAIRNEVYKAFLMNLLAPLPGEQEKESDIAKPNIATSTPVVFISYSHHDENWRKRFEKHLKALEMQGTILIWDDHRIKTGDNWSPRINEAINRADLALLLISPDFLASEFIIKKELPDLLERKKQGMPVFPVIIRHCIWEAFDCIKEMKMQPIDAGPIENYAKKKQEEIITGIVKELLKILKNPGSEK